MNKSIWAAMLCTAAAVTSCNTVSHTAETIAVNARVEQTPAVADLDVMPQRVSKTTEWRFRLVPLGEPTLAQRKKNVVYDMLDSVRADVLVEPQTRFTKRLFGPRTLTVSGYPARLKNFRNATPADLEALRIVRGESAAPAPQAAPAPAAPKPVAAAVRRKKAEKNAIPAMRKNVRYARLGLNFQGLTGGLYEFENKVKGSVGYDLSFGWQHLIGTSSFYYAIEGGLSTRGFRISEDYSDDFTKIRADNVRLAPINFGYKWNFAGNYVLDAHLGGYALYSYAGSSDYYSRLDGWVDWEGDYDGFDVGLQVGLGLWMGRFNVDFTYRQGGLEWQETARSRNCVLSVAYAF